MTMPSARKRITAAVAGLIGVALTVSGCGSDAASDAGAAPSDGAYPVTIDTAYGDVTVTSKPQRIVALGTRHIELLSVLDEKPIAYADYGLDATELVASYPWMKGQYPGDPQQSLFTAEFQPAAEEIAALKPDLILTTIWQTDQELYKQLSQIAPTYVGVDAKTNTTWQDDLTSLAELTGHDGEVVEQEQGKLDTALAAAATRLPGLQDKTFYAAALGDGDQLWLTEYAAAPILGLGMKPGDGQPVEGAEAADAPKFSQENIDKLTADVVFIAAENRDPSGKFRAALEADPRLAALPASKNETLIFLEPGQWNAVNGGSPASLIWWLDDVTPELEKSALNRSGQ